MGIFPSGCFIYLLMLHLCVYSGIKLNLNSASNTTEFWQMEDLYTALEYKLGFPVVLTGWRDLSVGRIQTMLQQNSCVIPSPWYYIRLARYSAPPESSTTSWGSWARLLLLKWRNAEFLICLHKHLTEDNIPSKLQTYKMWRLTSSGRCKCI